MQDLLDPTILPPFSALTPTRILRRGERVAHTMGAISRTRLAEFIEEALEGKAA